MNMNSASIPIPEDFLCPITQELMRDPVVTADGQSYERKAITQWLQKGHKTSPLTGEKLKNDVLIENHRLKAIIETFWQSLPEIQREEQATEKIKIHNVKAQKREVGKYDEALKQKDEENKALKKDLLKTQRQLQEIQTKMPTKKSLISKKSNNKTQVAHVDFAKKDLKSQPLVSSERLSRCRICHVKIVENLVFRNEYCRHQYCLYCVQEAGIPRENSCVLESCPARLNISKLKKFLGDFQSERKDNKIIEQKKDEDEKEEKKVEESRISNIKAEGIEAKEDNVKEIKIEEEKIQDVPLKEILPKKPWLWQNIQTFFQFKE